MNPTQLIQNRSVLLIFRDCLKLASRMVDNPVKTRAVRVLIRQQFYKNRDVVDQQQIRSLKLNAARAISNYLIYTVKEQYKLKENRSIFQQQDDEHQEQKDGNESGQSKKDRVGSVN